MSTMLHWERRGHGADVVLVHGWGLHAGIWAPLMEALSAHQRVHACDLPGHGASHAAPTPEDLAGWAQAVLAAAPLRATWVAWSLGGLIALTAARLAPARITRLVLIGTTPKFVSDEHWPHGMASATLAQFAQALESDHRATLQRFLSLQLGQSDDDRALLRELRMQLFDRGAPEPAALRGGLALLRDSDLRNTLSGVHPPTLVLHGTRDQLVPSAAGAWLAAHLPQAQWCPIEGAGHVPFLSHRATLLPRLTEFLATAQRHAHA
jgi:pimeloyl-[acyl-carrier protein] methyl ester esterase